MNYLKEYRDTVVKILDKIKEREEKNIKKAADIIAEKIMEDRLIYVFGSGGHSNMATEEMFSRAGGLAAINPIFAPGIGVPAMPSLERLVGYAELLLQYYKVQKDDVLLIVSAYGINAVTIEAALEAKKIGATTIGITARGYPDNVPPDHVARHPSNKNLYEIVDLFINTHVPLGDAVVKIEGFKPKVAPISTIANSFAINLIVTQTVTNLIEKGITPSVWTSSNAPGGEEANRPILEKYGNRIRYI